MTTTPSTEFTKRWTQAMSWSQSQGISYPVFKNVYNLGAQKYQTGGGLDSVDDIQAMLSAAQQQSPIVGASPQSNNPLTNTGNDLQTLLSSLTHIPGQLYHQGAEVFDNPRYLDPMYAPGTSDMSQVGQQLGVLKKVIGDKNSGFNPQLWSISQQERANNPIWSNVPGFSDLEEGMSGPAGLKEMWDNPLYTALDLGGITDALGRVAESAGARLGEDSALGAALTTAGGIARAGVIGGSVKAIGHIPIPLDDVFDDTTGKYKKPQIKDYMLGLQKSIGISPRARDMSRIESQGNSQLLEQHADLLENLAKTINPLSNKDRAEVTNFLTQESAINPDGSINHNIINPNATPQQQQVINAIGELLPTLTKKNVDAGLLKEVPVHDINGNVTSIEHYAKGSKVAEQNDRVARMNARQAQKRVMLNEHIASTQHLRDARDLATRNVINTRETLTDIDIADLALAQDIMGIPANKLTNAKIKSFQSITSNYLNKVETAYRDGDVKRASRVLKSLKRKITSSSIYSRSPVLHKLIEDIDTTVHHYEEAVGHQERIPARIDENGVKHPKTRVNINGYQQPIDRIKKSISNGDIKLNVERDKLNKLIKANPPAKYMPALNSHRADLIRPALNHDGVIATPKMLSAAMQELTDKVINGVSFKKLMDDNPALKTEWKKMSSEIQSNWQQFHAKGLDPVYLPNIEISDATRAFKPKLIASETRRPDASYERSLDTSTEVRDAGIQISHYAKQTLEYETSQHVYEQIMDNFSVSYDQAHARAEKMWNMRSKYVKDDPRITRTARINHIMDKELGYKTWRPEEITSMFPMRKARPSDLAMGKIMLPGDIIKVLHQMKMEGTIAGLPGVKQLDATTGLFKTSLLALSPRFDFHIMFGGMALIAARTGPGIFATIPKAFRMLKDGEFPFGMSKHMAESNSVDFTVNIATGRTYKRLALQSHIASNPLLRAAKAPLDLIKGIAQWNFKMNDTVANMYHVMTYLYGEKKGGPEEGIRLANKVFADLDNMTPMERIVISRIFPFWGWTKHIIKYLATYPADHPYRTSIMSSLSQQWAENWQSGVPGHMSILFDLGNPDPVTGNFDTVDFRQINPFRDTWDLATFAGWNMSMNPLALGVEAASGVNTMSASPDMYPALSYNSFYGSNSPSISGAQRLMGFADAVVPQAGILDALAGVSQQIRTLKQYDPVAYREQVFQMLGVPELFSGNTGPGIGPIHTVQTQNIYQIEANNQLKIYEDLNDQVTSALSGNIPMSQLLQYQYVPYDNELMQPQQLINLANNAETANNDSGGLSAPPVDVLPYQPTAKF